MDKIHRPSDSEKLFLFFIDFCICIHENVKELVWGFRARIQRLGDPYERGLSERRKSGQEIHINTREQREINDEEVVIEDML
jgi:hypothetical protein